MKQIKNYIWDFNENITTKIIRFEYKVSVSIIAILSVVFTIYFISEEPRIAFFIIPIAALLILFKRLVSEVILVLFKIEENTRDY